MTKIGTLLAGATLVSILISTTMANAAPSDYEFQLVQPDTKSGEAILDVRLVDKRSGKTVPDAVIFAKRIDMALDGMEMMTAPIEELPSTQPGVYRFKAQITMAGGWRLSLGAKVQGETDTVENKLVLQATQ